MSRILGIVLAAGMSRRLGRPKQLLMLDGTPLIVHIVDRALASNLDGLILVTGAHDADVRAAIEDRNVLLVHNPDFEEGQGSSLAAGITALNADVDAAVVLLGDQPGISPEVINRAIKARRESGPPVVMARYGNQLGHPVLFGYELFSKLGNLTADTGGRAIVRDHQDSLVLVDGGADAPPPDVDTEEAWAQLQSQWPSLRGPAPPAR